MSDKQDVGSPDIRIYLTGLIRRPVDGGAFDPELAAALKADDKRMVTLSAPGSIKWAAVTRRELRALVADGWRFDAETMAWANADAIEKG